MSETILITGGAGAIGSNLVRKLIKKYPRSKIIVIDNLSSGKISNINKLPIDFFKADITNKRLIKKIFQLKPNRVFHLAAQFANQNSVDYPIRDLNTNGIGFINILEECKNLNIKKIVYSSSSCVYGNLSLMTEKKIGKLDTPYAISKLIGEKYLEFYANHYKLPAISVRIFNTFGPFDYPGKYRSVVPNFFYDAIKNKPLKIYGDGMSSRTYSYVDDIVDGLIKLMFDADSNKLYEIFNLGSNNLITTIDLAKLINSIVKNNANYYFVDKREWDKVDIRIPDLRKLQNSINFIPKFNINDGLKKYYLWFLNEYKNKRIP